MFLGSQNVEKSSITEINVVYEYNLNISIAFLTVSIFLNGEVGSSKTTAS